MKGLFNGKFRVLSDSINLRKCESYRRRVNTRLFLRFHLRHRMNRTYSSRLPEVDRNIFSSIHERPTKPYFKIIGNLVRGNDANKKEGRHKTFRSYNGE